MTLREIAAKLINDDVDWAEWGKDDCEGERIADAILSLLATRIRGMKKSTGILGILGTTHRDGVVNEGLNKILDTLLQEVEGKVA